MFYYARPVVRLRDPRELPPGAFAVLIRQEWEDRAPFGHLELVHWMHDQQGDPLILVQRQVTERECPPLPLFEPEPLTVSDLVAQLRDLVEDEFPSVWVAGELSGFTQASSGHWYFTLKDASAQIKAAMFRGFNLRIRFDPKDGMEVIARGRVAVYEPRGDLQIHRRGTATEGNRRGRTRAAAAEGETAREGLLRPEAQEAVAAVPASRRARHERHAARRFAT